MGKFKAGDRVKVVDPTTGIYLDTEGRTAVVGDVLSIEKIEYPDFSPYFEFDCKESKIKFGGYDGWFELVEDFPKKISKEEHRELLEQVDTMHKTRQSSWKKEELLELNRVILSLLLVKYSLEGRIEGLDK